MQLLHIKIILALSLIVNSISAQEPTVKNSSMVVMAYYAGRPSQLDSFDVQKITHLIYCFGHLQGSKFHIARAADTALIQQMVALKTKNPALKIMVSLGGWGGCAPCSEVFSTKRGQREFTKSVKEIRNYFHIDGIDLDWEYPAVEGYPGHAYAASDKEHFTQLIKKLRKKLGKEAVITFAAGGFQKYLDESVDWKNVMPRINYVNLMTYDLVSGYATTTGHHTSLFSTDKQQESTDRAVQNILKKGVPSGKIIIGGAFYARMWEHVDSANKGLFQAGTFKAGISYKDFATQMSTDSGFVYYWDDVAKAPYAYNASRQLFATFDDTRSSTLKAQYAVDNHLGGIMFWQLSDDMYVNGLLDAIDAVRKNYVKK